MEEKSGEFVPLNKEDYIAINLVLFREYTNLLRTQACLTQEDAAEYKEHIAEQIEEILAIQRKIHKIIISLNTPSNPPQNLPSA